MLETVARAAAEQQHVWPFRVQVDQEIAVRAVLVLADPRLGQWSAPEEREATVAKGDNLRERGFGRTAALRIGVDLNAMRVVRELDPAALEIGEAVEDVAAIKVCPAGHRSGQEAAVAGRRSEEEDFLARRLDSRADHLGEKLGEPRARSEHEAIGGHPLARRKVNLLQPLAAAAGRPDRAFQVRPAGIHEAID